MRVSGKPKIVIVGGGIAGLACAWWLGQRGNCRVVLVESESDFGQHSTGRNASILRTAIPDGPLRKLAAETRQFLELPPAGFARAPLLDPCGVIVVTGDGARPEWELDPASPLEELSRMQMSRLAPYFHAPVGRFIHFREEGRLDVPLLVESLVDGARRAGVELRTGTPVQDLVVRAGRVDGVRCADGTRIEGDWTVLAAGGWAGRLGQRAGSRVTLTPTRRHLAVTGASRRVDPDWPIVWSDVDGFYVRPEAGGLLLSSCDQADVDPDLCDPMPSIREEIRAVATRHLGDLGNLPITRFWAGVRTLTSDSRFLVGPDGHVPGLFWVAGLGGHGMTTSIATGRIASDLLLGELEGADDLARALSPARPAITAPLSSSGAQLS
ncbi:MAG: D-arginine dehydrogenase [Chlamydiales bacterium]|jgi:D-arginine dehydrogenase